MVMKVEVRHDDSFMSMPHDDVQVILVENNDMGMVERSCSNVRDTSDTCRDVNLDNTRQTVNTHTSILDLTKEEEEEEDDEECVQSNSILFDELHSLRTIEENATGVRMVSPSFDTGTVVTLTKPKDACQMKSSQGTLLGKIPFFNETDSFVDSLCPGAASATCTPRFTSCHSVGDPKHRVQVGMDVLQLLGCSSTPGDEELEEIWAFRTAQVLKAKPNRPPVRASIKERMKKINRMRMERSTESRPTRHGLTFGGSGLNSRITLARAHTMDILDSRRRPIVDPNDPLSEFIGKGLDPILPSHYDTGYDSDPDLPSSSTYKPGPEQYRSSLMTTSDTDDESSVPASEDQKIKRTVQETLNSTWTLTWHPNKNNMTKHSIPSKPICINIWIERGTVILQNGVVVEPMLMWCDAYQPELEKRRLNKSSQRPWSMRLLNTCRIAAATTLDRNKYALARKHHSFYLRTCNGEEFLLEASSQEEQAAVCHRWKMAVARFASLAVTEDIDSIAEEFFHPSSTSTMLTSLDS